MLLCHDDRKLSETELSFRGWTIAVTGLTIPYLVLEGIGNIDQEIS